MSALYSTALTGGTRKHGSEETWFCLQGGGKQAMKHEPKDEKYYIALVLQYLLSPMAAGARSVTGKNLKTTWKKPHSFQFNSRICYHWLQKSKELNTWEFGKGLGKGKKKILEKSILALDDFYNLKKCPRHLNDWSTSLPWFRHTIKVFQMWQQLSASKYTNFFITKKVK